jgi:hypothetical protein
MKRSAEQWAKEFESEAIILTPEDERDLAALLRAMTKELDAWLSASGALPAKTNEALLDATYDAYTERRRAEGLGP